MPSLSPGFGPRDTAAISISPARAAAIPPPLSVPSRKFSSARALPALYRGTSFSSRPLVEPEPETRNAAKLLVAVVVSAGSPPPQPARRPEMSSSQAQARMAYRNTRAVIGASLARLEPPRQQRRRRQKIAVCRLRSWCHHGAEALRMRRVVEPGRAQSQVGQGSDGWVVSDFLDVATGLGGPTH